MPDLSAVLSTLGELGVASDSGRETRCAVAVVGASSMVGRALLPILVGHGHRVVGFSRKQKQGADEHGVTWCELSALFEVSERYAIRELIWLAPIIALPDYFALLQRAGIGRIVVVSTTSRFTKINSASSEERAFVSSLVSAEEALQTWAEKSGVGWTILRPTLIYGLGMDKNVSVIAHFICRFRFFTILGKAQGLRQPIHVRDVASACYGALCSPAAVNHAYIISGAEVLTYREMVGRIFEAVGLSPRFLRIPLGVFSVLVAIARLLPRYRSLTVAMAERMNQDMAFDHTEASRDFGFSPGKFLLQEDDLLPVCRVISK